MAILKKNFSPQKYQATYYVEDTHEGMRLDQFLQIYLETWSRQAVKRIIKSNNVAIENRNGVHKPSTILHYKEKVTLTINRVAQEDEFWNGKKLEINEVPDVLFEDDNLIVISKPAYMSAHPTGSHLFNCATVYFGNLYNKTIHSIHRLDRETSGVMMLGKDPKTATRMGDEFFNDRARKCYFFIAKKNSNYNGDLIFESYERLGAIEGGLKRVYINYHPVDSVNGKHAHTKFAIFYEENGYVLGLAFPQTGRQHQIRVHALVRGLPLVGDKLYLGSFKMFQRFKDKIATAADYSEVEFHRHMLHAVALKVRYNNEYRIFKSSIPEDFIPFIKEKLSISIDLLNSKIHKGVLDYFESNS